jgi:hypothetical protein
MHWLLFILILEAYVYAGFKYVFSVGVNWVIAMESAMRRRSNNFLFSNNFLLNAVAISRYGRILFWVTL